MRGYAGAGMVVARLVIALIVGLAVVGVAAPGVATGSAPAVFVAEAATVSASEDAWSALRAGGSVALIRHALAPGTGDPPTFVLDDCATQRNLSRAGREQAVRIGEAFRAHGVTVDLVLSSGWCRCIETAQLAFGAAEVWSPLHSFFRDAATEQAQTDEARTRAAAWTGPGTLVMVTHQVNITALTGIFPASGEVIALSPAPDGPAGFAVAGRVVVD